MNFVSSWSEFVRGEVRDIGNSSVLLRRRQRGFCRSQVLPIFVERHGQLWSVSDGVIWKYREVERQDISRPALERVRQGGHNFASGKIKSIGNLIVFECIGSTHDDYVTHRQIVGRLRHGDGTLLHANLFTVSIH